MNALRIIGLITVFLFLGFFAIGFLGMFLGMAFEFITIIVHMLWPFFIAAVIIYLIIIILAKNKQ